MQTGYSYVWCTGLVWAACYGVGLLKQSHAIIGLNAWEIFGENSSTIVKSQSNTIRAVV